MRESDANIRPRRSRLSKFAALVACACASLWVAAVEHPYILWTRDEAAALRKVIETQGWAKRQYAVMGQETSGKGKLEMPFRNLFAFTVMGDTQAGAVEKAALLNFANETPEGKSRYYSPYPHALRYDALYELLAPDQRQALEAAFRRFADYHLHKDRFVYSREAFLPNMQWNRVMGTHLMAVALGDEALIRALFASNGGWKWYMDEYVADGAFYFEEFGKQYSMMTEMLLWCRGLERLGLNQLGFGYTGKGGATTRSYLESILRLGYPRTQTGDPRPVYHRLTMGDAGDIHAIVRGYGKDGTGGNARWGAAKMNGGVPRMTEPLWFELGHAKWPDAGFDYLLAQMRPPDSDKYYPSLFFLAEPVDPAKAKPPPAPSVVARERGFALLRADESPAYWEGGASAVGFQFAVYYMHYTSACFSLLQLVANNRVLYRRQGIARGYAGGCPWTDNVRANSGVVVDGLRARAVGEVPVRCAFGPLVKFTAALGAPKQPYPPVPAEETTEDNNQRGCYRAMTHSMGREIYPGVDLERALFLTREYLFDVYRLASDRPRVYHWQVQVVGSPELAPAESWQASDDLSKGFYNLDNEEMAKKVEQEPAYYQLKNVRRRDVGAEGFSVTFRQGAADGPAAAAAGVRVHLLGAPDTKAYCGHIAGDGHTTFIAARTSPATVFGAVHEPYEGEHRCVQTFRVLQQTADGIAVAITGPDLNDRVLYRYFRNCGQPLTLSDGAERFTFADRAFIRIGADKVEVFGDLRAASIRVRGTPKLVLNGRETAARVEGGILVFGSP